MVKQAGTEPLTMDYDMEKTAAGWKVYDIKIDGISLITTYRETFADKVREGGVDGLIKSLVGQEPAGRRRRSGTPGGKFLCAGDRSDGFCRGHLTKRSSNSGSLN